MVESAPRSDTGDRTDSGTPPRMPGWVKAVGIVVGLLILLFVILQLTGIARDHGPGRHISGLGASPPGVPEGQAVPAPGVR